MKTCNICLKSIEGFTLIELLVTVILVAVLASYSVYYYNNTIDEGRLNSARGKLAALGGALDRYFIENPSKELYCPSPSVSASSTYGACEADGNGILDVFACGNAEPSLGREANFDFYFGCPSGVTGCGTYNTYTVYMIPKEESNSDLFPKCAYFDKVEEKVKGAED